MKRLQPFRLIQRVLAAALLMLGAQAVQAACVLGLCSCSVASPGIAFGDYNPLLNTARTTSGTVRVTCNAVAVNIPYTVALSTGTSGTYTMRTMRLGGYSLNYNLYLDADYTQVWSNTAQTMASGTISLNLIGVGAAGEHTINARIPAGQQTAVPGQNYTDTITMTVTYY